MLGTDCDSGGHSIACLGDAGTRLLKPIANKHYVDADTLFTSRARLRWTPVSQGCRGAREKKEGSQRKWCRAPGMAMVMVLSVSVESTDCNTGPKPLPMSLGGMVTID